MLRFISSVVDSAGNPGRTEPFGILAVRPERVEGYGEDAQGRLVEVQTFLVRQAHHERKWLRDRNSENQNSVSNRPVILHEQLGVPFDVDLLGHRHTLEVFVQDPPGLRSPPSDVDRDLMVHDELEQLFEWGESVRLHVLP